MAFAQNSGKQQSSATLRTNDRLALGLIGMAVIFASLGLGEAVYRFAFRDFDGDRLGACRRHGFDPAWACATTDAIDEIARRAEFVLNNRPRQQRIVHRQNTDGRGVAAVRPIRFDQLLRVHVPVVQIEGLRKTYVRRAE